MSGETISDQILSCSIADNLLPVSFPTTQPKKTLFLCLFDFLLQFPHFFSACVLGKQVPGKKNILCA